jgi:hypothetical protein
MHFVSKNSISNGRVFHKEVVLTSVSLKDVTAARETEKTKARVPGDIFSKPPSESRITSDMVGTCSTLMKGSTFLTYTCQMKGRRFGVG